MNKPDENLFNVDRNQFMDAVKKISQKQGIDIPTHQVEDMHRAMRADGEFMAIVTAAGGQIIEASQMDDTAARARTIEDVRGALALAAVEHRCKDLMPQIWGMVVLQVMSSGYEKMFEMMLEGRQLVMQLREVNKQAAEELSEALAAQCEEHRERLNTVGQMLAADGFAAVCTVQMQMDDKAKRDGMGQNWRGN